MLATPVSPPVERCLPAMSACLDAGVVLDACREQLTGVSPAVRNAWRSARMIEALYHPERYLRVVYALLKDESTPAIRLWPEGTLVYLHAPVRAPMSRRGTVLTLGTDAVEAYCFPNDRRLRGLRTFARRDLCTRVWQSWVEQSGDDAQLHAETMQRLLVRYVPEQKWVVRLRAEFEEPSGGKTTKRRVAVRSSSPGSIATLLRRHRLLARPSSDGVAEFSIPRIIGAEVDRGLMGVEWVRGESLFDTLCQRDVNDVMHAVASRLAAFHRTAIPQLPSMAAPRLVVRTQEATEDLSKAYPTLGERLGDQLEELSRIFETADAPTPVTLHNDFHWNQLSIKRDRFTLLDLERMATGDPLLDVANFASELQMLGHRPEQGVDEQTADRWRQVFLHAWAEVGGGRAAERHAIDAKRFHAYAALSRLELARGMMRHLRPGWTQLATRCVEMATDDLVRQAEGGSLP